jgi:hypothetical protein
LASGRLDGAGAPSVGESLGLVFGSSLTIEYLEA